MEQKEKCLKNKIYHKENKKNFPWKYTLKKIKQIYTNIIFIPDRLQNPAASD